MNDDIVSLQGVSRVYRKARIPALSGVTLGVRRGEHVALMGPSGSGKSTLLHVLSGLDHPTSGRVLFEGAEPGSRRAWARLRAERIGFVFQSFNLMPTFTASENVQIPMVGVRRGARERRRRADELLERVGLGGRARHFPAELSGGERQRVAIARSLANAPDLILADEPTGNLDSRTSGEILDLLCDIHRGEGSTLVVVTHEQGIAERACRVVRILDGRTVEPGQG